MYIYIEMYIHKFIVIKLKVGIEREHARETAEERE